MLQSYPSFTCWMYVVVYEWVCVLVSPEIRVYWGAFSIDNGRRMIN